MLEYADVYKCMCACVFEHFHCATIQGPPTPTLLNSLTCTSVVHRGAGWRTSRIPLVYPPSFSFPSLSPSHPDAHRIPNADLLRRPRVSKDTHAHAKTEHCLLVIYKKPTDRRTRPPFCLIQLRIVKWNSSGVIRFNYGNLKWPNTTCLHTGDHLNFFWKCQLHLIFKDGNMLSISIR